MHFLTSNTLRKYFSGKIELQTRQAQQKTTLVCEVEIEAAYTGSLWRVEILLFKGQSSEGKLHFTCKPTEICDAGAIATEIISNYFRKNGINARSKVLQGTWR